MNMTAKTNSVRPDSSSRLRQGSAGQAGSLVNAALSSHSVRPDSSSGSLANAALSSHSVRPELVEGCEQIKKYRVSNSFVSFDKLRTNGLKSPVFAKHIEKKINLKNFFLSLSLFLLPGCAGSKYNEPIHKVAKQFTQSCDQQAAEPLADWWLQFKDPLLNRLIDHAVAQNYSLKIAAEKIEESRALYQFKRAQLFPQIDAVAQVRRTRFSTALVQTSFLPTSRVSFFQFGTDAFWELDFWGRLRHAKNAQFHAFQAKIENMRNILIILLADVANQYIDICALTQKLLLITDKIDVERAIVCLEADRFASGLANEQAVTIAKQALATSLDLYEQVKAAQVQSYNQLAILLGLNPEQLPNFGLHKKVPLSQYKLAVGIPSELLKRRPDIRQAERTIASKHESVSSAVADWFPRFTLFGGLNSETSQGSAWFTGPSLSWFISPSIRWPLINFGRIKANIEVAQSQQRQAVLAYTNTVINALKDVEDFLTGYCHAKEQLKFLAQKYKQATIEQTLNYDLYCAGLADEQSYLLTKNNSLNRALEVVDASQAVSSNLVGLYKALGGGW